MNHTLLQYKPFSFHPDMLSLNPATLNKIFINKPNTNLHTTWAHTSSKVRCESLPEGSRSTQSMNQESSPPLELEGVVWSTANYVPLSPISFLERAAQVYRDRASVIYGPNVKYTWKETHHRCIKLASALNHLGISRGDVVATLAPNIPAMIELHFAIPMTGAVICTLNTRLNPSTISNMLKHSEAKILFVDYQLLQVAHEAIRLLKETQPESPFLVIIPELHSQDEYKTEYEYESLVESGATDFSTIRPQDECDPISLSYTSGTTSKPKGVVYSHRGAYLNSLACVSIHGMGQMPTYLWSVPMFHCNGWCLLWGVAAVGGTNVCLRRVDPEHIFDNIVFHKVTHMSGAPTVLNMIATSLHAAHRKLPHKVEIMTGGAPPPSTIISKIEEVGFRVSHGYGLTETFGLATWCLWKPEWDHLPVEEKAKRKARQGVKHFGMEEVDVKDPVTMESVKCDGKSMGEIMFRGNTVMSGYLKDPSATKEAFAGGWFRSGDLGVKHEDGYIEVKDRSKDIVISGGENISTVEVESVIYRHEGVLEVAVVGRPDDHWGQTPCAFVKLKEGVDVDADEIIKYCRDHMPHYMAPRTVVFQDLPRNSTGKIEKSVLRKRAQKL